MPTVPSQDTAHASRSYAALRRGGAPPGHATAQLGLQPSVARELERLFQRNRCGSGAPDSMRPRFVRHDQHVAAVLAAGGFPTLNPRGR